MVAVSGAPAWTYGCAMDRLRESVTATDIATKRLELLPLQVEFADEMATVLGDPALHTFIGGAPLSARRR